MKTMVRIAALSLALLAALAACQHARLSSGPEMTPPPDEALRIATYNVHYILMNQPEGRWGLDGWKARKRPLNAAFGALDADIVAFQEMESFAGSDDDSVNLTRQWLLVNNPDYGAAAIGDWRLFPSTQPIFYRKERFDVVDQGWFFFSDTPDVIYSRTFNGSYPAFASWAQFREARTGIAFRVLNLHLDYGSRENRWRSAELVAERLATWIQAGETVILAGDLNARAGSSLHQRLGETGLTFVPVPGASYHLDRGLNLFGAIDHIGYAGDLAPAGPAMVLREKFGDVWPSDHYPVAADFVPARP